MIRCKNIDKCEWWFCREKKLCLLEEKERTSKTISSIYDEVKRTGVVTAKTKIQVKKSPKTKHIHKKSNVNNFGSPFSVRRKVFERDNYTCQFCGSKENLTLDHIWPKSKGGKFILENLKVLCFPCNQRKSDKHPYEYNG